MRIFCERLEAYLDKDTPLFFVCLTASWFGVGAVGLQYIATCTRIYPVSA